MKILAKVSHDTFICQVGHGEIEKFLGLYYGKMKQLNIGDDVDLGKGCDHASQIADAMRKTREFVTANQQVVTAILNGLHYEKIVAENSPAAVQS